MKCRAKEAGFYKSYISEGQEFNWPDNKPVPSWAESIEPVKAKSVKANPVKEKPESGDDGESDEMTALREKAKEAGYKYWQNAGKKKLVAAIAEADAEREAKEAEEAQAVADKEAEEAEKAAQAAEEAKADAEGK
jgi:hypothetical protein